MNITVLVITAIDTLKQHYEAHQTEYAAQLAGWQEKMKEYSESLNAWASGGGEDKKRPVQPHKPQAFKKEYKRLIKMLELHTGSSIELDESDFNQIFLDQFNWKHTFLHNSTTYGVASLNNTLDDGDEDDDGDE